MKFRILLIGKNGQLGWELQRELSAFADTIPLGRTELDLADVDRIRQTIRQVKPQVIVNAAAYTAVDKAETDVDQAKAVNSTAPRILAEEADRADALIVHYSTDYVFDGSKGEPYIELDQPNPLNAYGRSKLHGEQAILDVGGSHLVIRTSWVYGARGSNFFTKIRQLASERESIEIVADQTGSPTWCREIAEVTAKILSGVSESLDDERLRYAGVTGLYHYAASGSTSWHGLARAIIDLDPMRTKYRVQDIVPIATNSYPSAAVRPKYSVLSSSRMTAEFGITPSHWRTQLTRCYAAFSIENELARK